MATALRFLKLAFSRRYASPRRILTVVGMLGVFCGVGAFVAVFRALDHVLYPGLRKARVEEPIFVIANPRSGTTFMHRLMCLDEERFTYFKLWQTMLPSVTLYRLVGAIAWADARVGRPLAWLLRRLEKVAFGGWDGVHAVGFERAEEEEMLFLTRLLTPSMFLFFPFGRDVRYADYIDQLPDKKRKRLMRYYKESLRRHVFATGQGRAILSKNVFFAGRMESILETFPDARFVHLVRHPYSAIPSLVSMFAAPWRFHSPEWEPTSEHHRYWSDLGIAYYKTYLTYADRIDPEQFIALTYDELVSDPRRTIERVYEQLEIPMSEAFRKRLDRETQRARTYKSSHGYSLEEYGLDAQTIYEELRPVFERYGFDPQLGDELEREDTHVGPTAKPQEGGARRPVASMVPAAS